MHQRFISSGISWVMLGFVTGLLLGCNSAPKTTTIKGQDLDQATQVMAASLNKSAFLADRTAAAPPMVITINKVENLTSDLISPAEQWMQTARIFGAFPIRELEKTKNIRFQIPPEQQALVRQQGFTEPLNNLPQVTHVMTAVYRSSTRVVRDKEGLPIGRQEFYFWEYKITNLANGALVWQDSVEFKHAGDLTDHVIND